MSEIRGTEVVREDSCPDCGHPNAKHEGSPEDEFVASHGGVGYAFCRAVDPGSATADPCGCRTVIGISQEARDEVAQPDRPRLGSKRSRRGMP